MNNFDFKQLIEELSLESKIIWQRIFNWREIEIKLPNLPLKYASFAKQKIIFIQDKILEQEAIFNFSRHKRPQPQQTKTNEISGDPFCSYQTETPLDEIGRLENDSTVTAANISKMADYHSLIIFKKHHLNEINKTDFERAIDLSKEWFNKIETIDPEIKTQFLIWNYNYRAGASISHPHFQVLAYRDVPLKLRSINTKLAKYQQDFQSNYFDDYFNLAQEMKLGQDKQNFKFWFSLTPFKEKGLNFYGSLEAEVLWLVIKRMIELGSENFNLFYVIKPAPGNSFGFFVDRGLSNKLNSDFGSLEIFGLPVISTNPFSLAQEFFSKF